MPISRMQQPRQMYGLGSFVKKAVKGVTGAVKSAAGGIKDILKSDAGKLALLAGGLYLGGGTGGISSLFGKAKTFIGGLPGAEAIGGYLKTKGGKTLLAAGAGTLLGGLGQKVEEGDTEAIAATRDVGALRSYLFSGYKNLGYTDDQAQELTNKDVAEYTSGQGGYATGGRVQYAMGTPEDKAKQASGIMGIPLNENAAGVTELDLRNNGGFIPPVGIKEKADDIPAMLSNNEFVFTADAVRGMGDGNVNKGAQRMYDMMKALEKRVV
jgi:hypothetical protein